MNDIGLCLRRLAQWPVTGGLIQISPTGCAAQRVWKFDDVSSSLVQGGAGGMWAWMPKDFHFLDGSNSCLCSWLTRPFAVFARGLGGLQAWFSTKRQEQRVGRNLTRASRLTNSAQSQTIISKYGQALGLLNDSMSKPFIWEGYPNSRETPIYCPASGFRHFVS